MQYSKEQLEKFLNDNFEMTENTHRHFNGKHGFTQKMCFNAGPYELVIWKNDEKFCIIGGPKGKLHKVFFSENDVITDYDDETMEDIFLNAKLKQELSASKAKAKVQKI